MTTAEKIKKARLDAGITQKDLGQRLGVSAAMIAQYESGKRVPKVETLQKIAQALDIDLSYFGIIIKPYGNLNKAITESIEQNLAKPLNKAFTDPINQAFSKPLKQAVLDAQEKMNASLQNRAEELNEFKDNPEGLISNNLSLLNDSAKKKVCDYIEDLLHNPENLKEK
ncbi:helix-turn-helix domain-containing protein [Catenibacillus scindens]|uniref:helix-turn-helix domain-containing protein n=1 Tax=Catenibacillus scindens TaxID=673271 RepID=UPI003209D379